MGSLRDWMSWESKQACAHAHAQAAHACAPHAHAFPGRAGMRSSYAPSKHLYQPADLSMTHRYIQSISVYSTHIPRSSPRPFAVGNVNIEHIYAYRGATRWRSLRRQPCRPIRFQTHPIPPCFRGADATTTRRMHRILSIFVHALAPYTHRHASTHARTHALTRARTHRHSATYPVSARQCCASARRRIMPPFAITGMSTASLTARIALQSQSPSWWVQLRVRPCTVRREAPAF
jgi:hypothetical protein